MEKIILITVGLLVIAALTFMATVHPPPAIQTPARQQAPEPLRPEDYKPATQPLQPVQTAASTQTSKPIPQGPSADQLTPQTAEFYVNKVRIPEYTGYNFFPIRKNQIKTFSGKFGPYTFDPTPYITILLCAANVRTNIPIAPACQPTHPSYREGYVTFAEGYPEDEWIGGYAAKDYEAYYQVLAGNKVITESTHAVIRTIND